MCISVGKSPLGRVEREVITLEGRCRFPEKPIFVSGRCLLKPVAVAVGVGNLFQIVCSEMVVYKSVATHDYIIHVYDR